MSKKTFKREAPDLSDERKAELLSFCRKHNIEFASIGLLNRAFIHTSFANDSLNPFEDNQRLEFLGDSILGAVTADFLYNRFENEDEGKLSKEISLLVSEESLSEVAFSIGLNKLILLGKGEMAQGGREKKAIAADALEAFIGALYLDSGYDKAKEFILSFIPKQMDEISSGSYTFKDYKSRLQEYYQKKTGDNPKYMLLKTEGPEHMKSFLVRAVLGRREFEPQWGNSKKNAEQNAAKSALIELGLERE